MELTLSFDDDVLDGARRIAEAMGTSVDQLVREYLESLAVTSPDRAADAEAVLRLSDLSGGNSQGWKFDRDEIQERG